MVSKGVIYIQRNKFQMYSPMLPSVLEFAYVPEMIRDLDVLNKDLLKEVIKVFIIHNKIIPGPLSIFLADDVAFMKDFAFPDTLPAQTSPEQKAKPDTDDKERKDAMDKQIKQYIDLIPFEEVSSKVFYLKNGARVYTTNKELYSVIIEAFEKEGFTIDMVIPGYLLGNDISAQQILTPQMAEFFLQHANTLKPNNLLHGVPQLIEDEKKEEKESESESYEVKEENTNKADKKRLFLMVGVLILLLVVLVIVYLLYGRQP